MLLDAAIVAGSYLIGSIPVAYLTGRLTRGVDIREFGSGNAGASNIWQSVSKRLVVPVGLAQIAQGVAGPLLAQLLGRGDGVVVAAAIAAVLAADWNPWLGFTGGRGVGTTIGALLVLSPVALATFVAVALAGVAVRAIPQAVALALVAAPVGALASEASAVVVLGCVALAAIALAKRVLANDAPAAGAGDLQVYLNRLIYDRDVRDRDMWVRRNI